MVTGPPGRSPSISCCSGASGSQASTGCSGSGIYVLLLPRVLAVSTIAVKSLQQTEASFLATRRIAAVLLDRGVRALIIAVAAIWLGHMLGVGADTMARAKR